MKKSILSILLTVFMSFAAIATYAQEQAKVEEAMKAIVEKYDNVEDFDCITVVKGEGLELIKAPFNKQFGKKFMKGVTSMSIIVYTDASKESCEAFYKDLAPVFSMMKEFETKGANISGDFKNAKFYAIEEGEKVLSDCIFHLEGDDAMTLLYMAGKLELPNL